MISFIFSIYFIRQLCLATATEEDIRDDEWMRSGLGLSRMVFGTGVSGTEESTQDASIL
jgi:hypothetical protein